MLVVYFTPDDVNEELAMQFAAACGLTVRCIPFGSSRLTGEFEAVVYDWDYLPLPWRPDILATLLWNPLPCPVALHGYHLAEEEIEALRANGVQVHHCLQLNVFRGLCPASKPNRTSDVAGGSDQLRSPQWKRAFRIAANSLTSTTRVAAIHDSAPLALENVLWSRRRSGSAVTATAVGKRPLRRL